MRHGYFSEYIYKLPGYRCSLGGEGVGETF